MHKLIFLIIGISWHILSGMCHASLSVDESIDKYVDFVSKKDRSVRFSEVQHQLQNQLTFLLLNLGTDAFKLKRNDLKTRLLSASDKAPWYWLKKIDEAVLGTYLLECTKLFKRLPKQHIAYYYHSLIKELAKRDNLTFFWSRVSYQGGSRGKYHHYNKQVSIDILDPHEIIYPLVHEMTHLLDRNLEETRYGLDKLKKQISKLDKSDHYNWNEKEKRMFGRYWFLRTAYLGGLKEYLPRVHTCQTFIDLYDFSITSNFPATELKRYGPVLRNNENCHTLTQKELGKRFYDPDFFWNKGKWQYDLIRAYYESWRAKVGRDRNY